MEIIRYSDRDISRAAWERKEEILSANPYQHLLAFREHLKEEFGTQSPIFQYICEGIFFVLSRTSLQETDRLLDLYDIENYATQMGKEKPAHIVTNFIYGYITGLAYLIDAAGHDLDDRKILGQVASRLLNAFTSPVGDYNF